MSNIDVHKFINLVKCYRDLYDGKLKIPNKKKVMEQRWLKITEQMTPNFGDLPKNQRIVKCKQLKKTWKSLIDNMRRTVKSRKHNYVHYREMAFIIPYLGRRWKSGNKRQQDCSNETSHSPNTQTMDNMNTNPYLLSLLNKLHNMGYNESNYLIHILNIISSAPEIVSAIQILFQLPQDKRSAMLGEFITNVKKMQQQHEGESTECSSESSGHTFPLNKMHTYENEANFTQFMFPNEYFLLQNGNGYIENNVYACEDGSDVSKEMPLDMDKIFNDCSHVHKANTSQDSTFTFVDEPDIINLIENICFVDEQETLLPTLPENIEKKVLLDKGMDPLLSSSALIA